MKRQWQKAIDTSIGLDKISDRDFGLVVDDHKKIRHRSINIGVLHNSASEFNHHAHYWKNRRGKP